MADSTEIQFYYYGKYDQYITLYKSGRMISML